MIRKFNEQSKSTADKYAEKGKTASNWMQSIIQSNYEDVPVKVSPSLREKASRETTKIDNAQELEILQKIVVRENFLNELNKLLNTHNGIFSVIGEIFELIKAIRFQTVDIIEDIEAWQITQVAKRPFLFRGINYLTKISSDLTYLDNYEELTQYFNFKFTGNPLAYREDLLSIRSQNSTKYNSLELAIDSFEKSGIYDPTSSVDGIDLLRLKNAEKVIQRNIDFETSHSYEYQSTHSVLDIGEKGMATSIVSKSTTQKKLHIKSSNSANLIAINNAKMNQSQKIWKKKFSALRTKQERIAQLKDEIDTILAMRTHLEDKIQTKVATYKVSNEHKEVLENRRKEALSLYRDIAAQKIAVQISMLFTELQTINCEIKDMQREIYFFDLEISRKEMILRNLTNDIQQSKKNLEIEKKLSIKIKNEGLVSALKTLNEISNEQMGGGKKSKKAMEIVNEIMSYSPPKDSKSLKSDNFLPEVTEISTESIEQLFIGEEGFQSKYEAIIEEVNPTIIMSNEDSTLNQKFEAISDNFAKDDQEHFVGSGTALNVARALKAELAVNKKIAPIEIENITPLSSGRIEEMSSRSSIYTEGNSYSTYETASENSELSEYQITPRFSETVS